jgi:DNA ligase-1
MVRLVAICGVIVYRWVSESFDGIRLYWDGKRLSTKNGTKLSPPRSFVVKLPSIPVEGILWYTKVNIFSNLQRCGYGGYNKATKLVNPADHSWEAVVFLLFDAPSQNHLRYEERYNLLKSSVSNSASVKVVEVVKSSRASIQELHRDKSLILRKPHSYYHDEDSIVHLDVCGSMSL